VPDERDTGGGPVTDEPASHAAILDAVAEDAEDRVPLRQQLARAALRRVTEEQLARLDPRSVADHLNRLFDLVDGREEGRTVVRARRPRSGVNGAQSGTVIQIASEDRPFLLSTVTEELAQHDLQVVHELHPIVGVERDDEGRLVALLPARTAEDRESLLHLELDRHLEDDEIDELVSRLHELVDDVMAVTGDHDAMRERLAELLETLRGDDADLPADAASNGDPEADRDEVADLIAWLLDDDLVLLGLREYEITRVDGTVLLRTLPGRGLGLLADDARSGFADGVPLDELPREVRDRLDSPRRITVTRTRRPATVQRQVPMEDLRIYQRGGGGEVDRIVRLLGLFTRKGLASPSASTPVLRAKLRHILEREDVVPGSHDEITLISLFEALPKDELFRSPTEELHRTLVGLMHAEEHREPRTLVRVDHELGAVTVLITTPRDTWSPHLREQLEALLEERYQAQRVDVDVALGDRHAAVGRFLLHVEDEIPVVNVADLQAEVRRLARPWVDTITSLLVDRLGQGEGDRLSRSFASRLPETFRQMVTPEAAIDDVLLLDAHRRGPRELLVGVRAASDEGLARVKAAKRGAPLVLSAFLPILESLGLEVVEEVPYRLIRDDTTLHDFGVRLPGVDLTDEYLSGLLADTVHAAWDGHVTVDSLNRLVLSAGLGWSDVALLRAYRRYRRQVGTAHTPEYVNDVLVEESEATSALVAHFRARFDPDHDGDRDAARQAALDACDRIRRLDHDRIVRGLLRLVDATLRTNAFRDDAVADGTGVPYLSLKLDPALVPDMPAPLPHREIFVFSTEVEGVHLRAGKVARGGLRWSDRRDDVRTEVLDLVKAQIRKNALIVPTGAKGGFVLKREPDDPGAMKAAVEATYTTFVRALLDVTDDLADDRLVPPPRVVRHDGDDPYLVVAADRGTATFSDTANAIAARYGFWLDDAFASGGSNGYDHKKLGVTAKGTWVAVRRHFRELGMDVQTDPLTIAGVGDMSGDVFGNGLLLSRSVLLVAAFDHRHVFLDPEPDPEASFEERRRLFELPGSTWADYDTDLISEGGGVFPRDAKSIVLSKQVRQLLRVEEEELPPPELLSAILGAPVDLLFAGGIGTYVKAAAETHDDVGDRANDEIRVNADKVRARMIAEGANLFITQPARIQYARRGGRIDQDAVHNAAGVATSDREVNLKILLNLAVEAGRIDAEERSSLLQEVADAVVAEVMADVDSQTAALSRELTHSPEAMGAYQVLLERLDDQEEFDREVEVLPDEDTFAERVEAEAGLTRPELATLLAWAKREIKEDLLASDVPDEAVLAHNLPAYFPPLLVERFGDLLDRHPLRRELIATVVTNEMVDRMGVSFASTLADERGIDLSRVVLAWEVARQVTDADHYQRMLADLESEHDPQRLIELHDQLRWLLSRITGTLLADAGLEDPEGLLARDRPVAQELTGSLLEAGSEDHRRARVAHARWLVDDLVPQELARLLASVRDLVIVPDVAVVAHSQPDRRHVDIADAFLRLGEALGIDELERIVERFDAPTGWARRQRRGLETDLRRLRRDAAGAALRLFPDADEATAAAAFLRLQRPRVARARKLVEEAGHHEGSELDALAVATRAIAEVTRT
jgi:glutamate dehydrogenase